MTDRTCSVCGRAVKQLRKGMCDPDYRAWRKYGDPRKRLVILGDDEARFWSKVDRRGDDECWPWKGHHDRYGYAVFSVHHLNVGAHRWAYEHFVGPIPDGYQVDHVKANGCTRRDCTNYIRHLEPVTGAENTLRGDGPSAQNARKDECDQGHEFTPENTYVYADGRRSCRECMRGYGREWQRKRRARLRESADEPGQPPAVT